MHSIFFVRRDDPLVARASLANNLRGHFMTKLVVLIADCVRPRASSIRLKQARKVLDLRGALTFPWAAQS